MSEQKKASPDVSITADWTRPRPLQVHNTDPGKAYRWVNKDNLEKRKQEGWIPTSNESINHRTPDSTQGQAAREYRELLLCEMPREQAEARNRYCRERARQSLESSENLYYQQARRLGFRTDV